MSIETQAKKLALLQKKRNRVQNNLNKLEIEIQKEQKIINKAFKKIGLDTNFS